MVRRMLIVLPVFGLLTTLAAPTLSTADAGSDQFVERIIELIGDQDREFRAAGLEQVRQAARGTEFTQRFAAQLTKLDVDGQIALLQALTDRGDDAARPAVLSLFASTRDESVRAAAIGALGRLGGRDDLPLLIHELSSESGVERIAARQSLIEISGATINQALADESRLAPPAEKAALLGVLAARRACGEMPTFVAATTNDDAYVRRTAMAAVGRLGRMEQITQLLPGVLKAEQGAERDDAEENVALICRRIGNEEQSGAALIAAIKTIDAAQRDELLSLVGRVGGNSLVDFVADFAMSEDASHRQAGIDALSKWPDASAADKLFDIVNNSGNATERQQAFQGYVRVAAIRDDRSDQQRLASMKRAMQAAKSPAEQMLVINRIRTAYDVESLRFVLPYLDQPQFTTAVCETIVEIAHHREVREPHKAEFDAALDRVIAKSRNAVVVERANRYKRGETWERTGGLPVAAAAGAASGASSALWYTILAVAVSVLAVSGALWLTCLSKPARQIARGGGCCCPDCGETVKKAMLLKCIGFRTRLAGACPHCGGELTVNRWSWHVLRAGSLAILSYFGAWLALSCADPQLAERLLGSSRFFFLAIGPLLVAAYVGLKPVPVASRRPAE